MHRSYKEYLFDIHLYQYLWRSSMFNPEGLYVQQFKMKNRYYHKQNNRIIHSISSFFEFDDALKCFDESSSRTIFTNTRLTKMHLWHKCDLFFAERTNYIDFFEETKPFCIVMVPPRPKKACKFFTIKMQKNITAFYILNNLWVFVV